MAVPFSWTETLGAEPLQNGGGLVFLKKGARIYSRAWRFQSKVDWPPVEGVGFLEGATIHVAYRSLSGEPDHEFYHAYCRFELAAGGRTFKCSFIQKATASPEAPLLPGTAQGKIVVEPSSEFQGHVASLEILADSLSLMSVSEENCPVLPLWPSEPKFTVRRNGRAIKLCCSSCLAVFEQKPEVFEIPPMVK